MRTKRFIASLLALLMLFSLMPTLALAEDIEEEDEGEIVIVEEEPEDLETEEALEPEALPEADEPEADPVEYDLWVCGVQVTSANAQSIDGSYMVRFDAASSTLTVYSNTFFKNNSTALHEGALIYSGLPELTINLQLGTTSTTNYIGSDTANKLICVANGDLTIVTKDGTSPQLKSGSASTVIEVNGGSFAFSGKMSVRSASALYGIYVPNGTVNNQGDLTVGLESVGGCAIYVGNGLSSSGPLSADNYDGQGGYGIKVMNGSVNITTSGLVYLDADHCGLYVANGDVNISGVVSFGCGSAGAEDSLCPSSGIYAANGEVTLGGVGMFGGASYVVYANGPVHVTGDVDIDNSYNLLGGNGIKSTTGGITIDGSANITAINGLDAGESTEGITVGGDLTIKASGRYGAKAENGPITVGGNLDVRGASYTAVTAKGDITVEGNAYAQASAYQTNPGNAMESTDGTINVTGNLSCYGTNNAAYAKSDIRVGGDALFSGGGDFNAKAENGELTVGGTLTAKGKAACSVRVGISIMVEKDITVANTAEDSIGMYAPGFIQFFSGKLDVSAGAVALQAGNGIAIPEGYAVTLPEHGTIAQVDDLHTVTERDGTTVAAHAIIEEYEATEGYFLIRPDWSFEDIQLTEKFEPNSDNDGEYVLNTTLAVGDQIKVVKVENDVITAWYPDGMNNQYTVDQGHSGTVDIYFKPAGDSAWGEFGGYFYIAHVHDWQVSWTWSEDFLSATATFTCASDPTHTETVEATVTVDDESMPASCYEDGYIFYDAVATFEGKNYFDYKEILVPAHHEWGEPTWEWAEDYSTATATFICQTVTSHKSTKTAEITEETTPAGCEVAGKTVYTATVTLDGETYTDTKIVEIPATGHEWGEPSWTWAEDNTATSTFVCAKDETHTKTVKATITSETVNATCEAAGSTTYTATVELEGKTYTDTKTVEIPAAGHEWGEPTWTWAEDFSSATAAFVCAKDETHTKTLEATITSEEVANGTLYTATVELDGKTYTDQKLKEISTVTVTFNAGDGAAVDPATVEVNVGEAIGELPTPTRDGGWVFLGWFTEEMESYLLAGQGTRVTAETTFDKDATVYAHWRLPGDINGDGTVNNKDLTRLQRYLRGDQVEVVAFNLDTNGDGSVNNKDLTRLQKHLKGETVELH